jgi:hypothetical protein
MTAEERAVARANCNFVVGLFEELKSEPSGGGYRLRGLSRKERRFRNGAVGKPWRNLMLFSFLCDGTIARAITTFITRGPMALSDALAEVDRLESILARHDIDPVTGQRLTVEQCP